MDSSWLRPEVWIALLVFIIAMMLSVGLQVSVREMLDVLRKRGLMGRALVANFILVPIVAFIVIRLFNLPMDVRIGLALLALAPGAPIATQFTTRHKGALSFAATLLFVLFILAVFWTPIVANLLAPAGIEIHLPLLHTLETLVLYLFIPLAIGRVLQRWASPLAARIVKPVTLLATLSFVCGVILMLGENKHAREIIGTKAVFAMLLIIVLSMVVGWFSGGPEKATRKVLVTNTSMRNIAVCLVIALNSFSDEDIGATIIAFSSLMIPLNMLFTAYHLIAQKRAARQNK